MKHFLLLLLAVIFTSCSPMERADYEYKITYNINGISFERTDNLLDVPAKTVPTYILTRSSGNHSNSKLIVTVIYAEEYTYPYCTQTVYEGNLTCNVTSFEYWKIRNFKASKWDGHEIKPRRNQ